MRQVNKIFLTVSALFSLLSCIKEEDSTKEKNNYFVFETPSDNKVFNFQDTVHVIGVYYQKKESDYSLEITYIVTVKNLKSGNLLIQDTLREKGYNAASHHIFVNTFSDTSEVLLQVFESSYNWTKNLVSERKIICLPN